MIARHLHIAILWLALMHLAPASAQISAGNRIGTTSFNQQLASENDELLQALTGNMYNVTGFAIAIPIEFMVTELFAIQPEVGFLTKGLAYDRDNAKEYRMNYTDLTILAKLNIGPGRLKGEVFAGPGVSIGVSTRTILVNNNALWYGPGFDQVAPFDYRSLSAAELNVTVGAGVSYSLGGPRLYLNYRYLHGLTDVYLLPTTWITRDSNLTDLVSGYSRGTMLSLGLLIPLTPEGWAD